MDYDDYDGHDVDVCDDYDVDDYEYDNNRSLSECIADVTSHERPKHPAAEKRIHRYGTT